MLHPLCQRFFCFFGVPTLPSMTTSHIPADEQRGGGGVECCVDARHETEVSVGATAFTNEEKPTQEPNGSGRNHDIEDPEALVAWARHWANLDSTSKRGERFVHDCQHLRDFAV